MSYEEVCAADRWIDEKFVFITPDEEDDATVEWLLDCLEVAVVRFGARVIVVDPFNELDHRRDNRESETEYIGRCIRTFKRFAKKFQVHFIVVAHPAKMQKVDGVYLMPTLYDINGSANWYNKADIGIIVHKQTRDDTIIKVSKSRYWESIGHPGEVLMQYCNDDRRFRECERLA
jgi:twinkle protein